MLCSNASENNSASASEVQALRAGLGEEALHADLYEFTMAQGIFLSEPARRGVFTYFIRSAPFGGGYIVAAGVESLLHALRNFRLSEGDLDYLRSMGTFAPEFLDCLRDFRFQGNVSCVAEGEAVFPGVPVLRIEGSLLETQLVSGLVMTHLNYQSLVATKASRVVEAAAGKPVIELGVRRAHGLSGSIYGSRAAYIGGVERSSNVLAGKVFGIPVGGTMGHSWIMSYPSEREAFEAYAQIYPDACTLLIDTYDSKRGLAAAVPVLRRLVRSGAKNSGVRIDSGDPRSNVKEVRAALDAHGLSAVRIVLSGDLDEHRIDELIRLDVPVDVFGVGGRMLTAHDTPALSGVYKLTAVGACRGELVPCMKFSDSTEKSSLPGVTNAVRYFDAERGPGSDLVLTQAELEDRPIAGDRRGEGRTLLTRRMQRGELVGPVPSLDDVRNYARHSLAQLPNASTALVPGSKYLVERSRGVAHLEAQLRAQNLGGPPSAVGKETALDPEHVLTGMLSRCLERTEFDWGERSEGKVRDSYTTDAGQRVLVTTDRISAFDRMLGTIPLRGQVLNRLSAWWFERTRDIVGNHLVATPDPNVTIARQCQALPVEMVVRAYMVGATSTSIWTHYSSGERLFCGHRLPEGLTEFSPLPEPLVTPSTKAPQGERDASVTPEALLRITGMSAFEFDEISRLSLALFRRGQDLCRERGLILVDTKYEFGRTPDGEIVVIDEMHTPDCSRFWDAADYAESREQGRAPESLDKEFVRRALKAQGFSGDGAAPALSDELRIEAARRYIEVLERLTAAPAELSYTEPLPRMSQAVRLQ